MHTMLYLDFYSCPYGLKNVTKPIMYACNSLPISKYLAASLYLSYFDILICSEMEKTVNVCQAQIVLNWKSEIAAFVVIQACVFRDEKEQTELVEVFMLLVFLCAPKYLEKIGLKQTIE